MTNIPTEDMLPEENLRLEGEEWRIIGTNYIKNCDDTYIVSSYGRIYNYKKKRFLSPNPAGNYLRVHIRSHDKDGKSIDNMENYEVDHIDGCSFNNYLDNLQWLSKDDNIKKDIESNSSRTSLMNSNKPIYNLMLQNNKFKDKLNKIQKENSN